MIEINKLNSRIYSKLGQSGTIFGIGLFDVMNDKADIFVLSSDMSRPAGLDRFKTMYPDRFYNVGIAEQNLMGIAAGLASEDNTVIVTAQAAFISMRSCEQLRQYLGYMKSNVIAVGISAGFALTYFGNTHYAIEDMAITRSIPGMTVISPSDAGQAAKALIAAVRLKSPVYIRLTGTLNCPVVYEQEYEFEIGKSIQLKEGNEITLFATGSMVHPCLNAAAIIEEKGISVRVLDVHTIKPLDEKAVMKCLDSALLVSVEEHNIVGGLGTSIAELMAEKGNCPPLLRLGVKDSFSHPGDYAYLLAQNRLQPDLIAEDILKEYQKTKQ
ncbi:MAG TPA: transketolase C-terminal domain-containing protein [Bacteroidales bacterium]|nr:transketolase C-terminal domain-containing protein [Bacteroidales bacterium]